MQRKITGLALGAIMLNFAVALPAAAKPYQPPGVQSEPGVAGSHLVTKAVPAATDTPFTAPAPVWQAKSTLDAAVRVQAYSRAAAKAAGVDGAVIRLYSDADGPTQVSVDYNSFRWAYGGDWASRLSLYVIDESGMRRVQSHNDTAKGTVTAQVEVHRQTVVTSPQHGAFAGAETQDAGGTLVALAAAPGGPGGDYKATSLSPSATWSAGGNTGDFGWQYPLRLPPSVGGPAPSISFDYSSSSVDGRMVSANNQASMIGEGFDWHPGYIERRYNVCAEDQGNGANNSDKTGDQCWETDNAALSLGGRAGDLIKNGSNANRWHLRQDDGTKIERKTGGPNSAKDGEWWLVTTPDGTQYWFGGRSGSNAVLTSTVFGNHDNEPCHQDTFAASHCTQGYRWQLDYVLDPHGNTMSFTYLKETNKYARNNKREDDTTYDRDGYLEKIEYGTRHNVAGTAPMRVLFTYGDRCLSDCGTKDAVHWPDVPWDQQCAADTCDYHQNSPSFWTTRRLATVKTQVWGGSAYRDVELWTLTHSFPSSDQPTLWLSKIAHSGLIGGSKTVPDITFQGVAMPNRVDTNSDQYPAMNRYRMKTITSETGGKVDILYTGADCVRGSRVPDKDNLQNNALRCYPVKWQPEDRDKPIDDFFHKYLVSDVIEADLSGSSSRVLVHYDYVGDPAWHYTDDDGFIKKDFKTWSVWRGYGTVRETKGDPGEQTREERRYFRGMHGDKLPSGTRQVQLPAIAVGNVPAINDEDAFAGMVRETITYNGPGGAEISAKVTAGWQSAPTASRTINGQTVHARHTGIAADHTRKTLDRGRGHVTTSQTTQFDSLGMPVRVDDRGDDAVTGDEQCTLTDYARNTGANILDKVSRKRDFGVSCATATGWPLTDGDVMSDTKTSYDQLDWGVAPSKGAVSKVEVLKAYNSGNPTYAVESSVTKHDAHGRPTEEWDARGGKTTTSYTPATGGPVTASTKTGPLDLTKSSVLEPAWGVPTSTTDANGRRVDLAYDPFGRLVSVWLPGRDKGTQTASIVYDYQIRNNAPTVVVTKRLNASGGYLTSYQFYDNLLRARQSQESNGAPGATGAVVTDTYYDSAGRAYKTYDPYVAKDAANNPVPPSTNLFLPAGNIPSAKVKQFDGSGREIAQITYADAPPASPGGTERWRTTTVYGGDRVDVIPPAGGIATSTVTNTVGKTTQVVTGSDAVDYTYDRRGNLAKVVDPSGAVWEYETDARGRQTKTVDPDKGTTTTEYNDAGDILSTTDGRGVTIAYTYDITGRKTSMRDGSPTGPKRAEWFYDTLSNGTPVKGHLVKTIRYEGADQYVKEHLGYTVDYKPTSVKYTIPNNATAGGVNGEYTYVYTYHQDGSLATTRLPAMGDMLLETLTHGYNALGKPTTLSTSLGGTYVTGTDYTAYNELGAMHLQHNAGARVDIVRTYDTQSRRLAQIWTTRATAPTTVSDLRYTYDAIGNITKLSDLTAGDHQCFTMDHLRRLREAWTASNGDCAAAPSAGGPSKYWHSYRYDAAGNRSQLIEHATATGERTTDYTAGDGHQVDSMSTSDTTGTRSVSYTYDASGNTVTRPGATLTWDAEGHLATSTDATGATSYVYDVDGSRLLRKDPKGKTLYLPGQELRYTTSTGLKTCARYYTHGDAVVATRTSGGVVWLSGDHHGTAAIAINAVGQATAIRRQTPFGQIRGTTGTWPSGMDKGFVGGTNDNTGLTHLGAREYDPALGRFISVDPVIDIKDPQQMHGYVYANNAPITSSDPDGLWPKWLDKAANTVKSAASTATKAVVTATKAVGSWVYDNAGTISTVLTVAAVACAIIPPLQAAAPFLGAAATAVGAIETYKSCKNGAGLDCAMGLAEMVPGGRAVGAVGKGAKYADDAIDLAKKKPAGPGLKPGAPDCHSFTPETPVLMADGGSKPIGEIKEGDRVAAKDPQTGVTGGREVTVLHRNLDQKLTDVTVVTGAGKTQTVKTTWTHPFWSQTRGDWVNAGDLRSGEVLSALDGTRVSVAKVRNYVGQAWMRDLTVADIHTYFVIAAGAPVLVHNNPPGACPIPGHTGTWLDLNGTRGDPPPGCVCKQWIDTRNPDRRPGASREVDNTTEKADEIKRQREYREAPPRALGSAGKDLKKAATDDNEVSAWGMLLAAILNAIFRRWPWLRGR